MNKYVFVDNYYAKDPGKYHRVIYIVKAYDEEEAWRKFSKYAIPEFGLKKGTTLAEVKAYFADFLTVYGPDNVMDFEGTHYEQV